jgi:outer membrane protein OmpA-like peptidoglycan-associated protein
MNAYNSQTKVPLTDQQLKDLGWNSTPAYFAYDQSTLEPDAKKLLNQNIEVMKKNTDLTVVVNGYADSRGTDAYNINLSAKRANSVKTYLIENGISKFRITTLNAYGESKIENGCTNDVVCDEDQHKVNRKVDFNVMTNQKMITFKD